MHKFFELIKKNNLKLIYVTGRNLSLFKEAVKEYGIIYPDYLISDTGAVVYNNEGGKMIINIQWTNHLKENAVNWNRELMIKEIELLNELRMQEESVQNEYKISYYLDSKKNKEKVLYFIKKVLKKYKIESEVIFSFDPLKNNVGLIDILPNIATKIAALEFVRKNCLKFKKENIIYCGDSGNDILPLTFGYKSVVVKNAPQSVKKEIKKIANKKKIGDLIYFCKGNNSGNGNYSSGIIEGIEYFFENFK